MTLTLIAFLINQLKNGYVNYFDSLSDLLKVFLKDNYVSYVGCMLAFSFFILTVRKNLDLERRNRKEHNEQHLQLKGKSKQLDSALVSIQAVKGVLEEETYKNVVDSVRLLEKNITEITDIKKQAKKLEELKNILDSKELEIDELLDNQMKVTEEKFVDLGVFPFLLLGIYPFYKNLEESIFTYVFFILFSVPVVRIVVGLYQLWTVIIKIRELKIPLNDYQNMFNDIVNMLYSLNGSPAQLYIEAVDSDFFKDLDKIKK